MKIIIINNNIFFKYLINIIYLCYLLTPSFYNYYPLLLLIFNLLIN